MADQRLRIFVSSSMRELEAERAAVRAALAEMGLGSFVFELDVNARPGSIQQTYLEETAESDLYVGLFWKKYGAHTIVEFEHARSLGMDCLIYEKRTGVPEEREPALSAFLDRLGSVEEGLTIGRFETTDELREAIKRDVAAWRERLARDARERAAAIVYGVPSRPPRDLAGRRREMALIGRALQSGDDFAIEGLPGVGKTTLALAIALNPYVRRHFKDGILWASLGPKADLANALAGWAQGLAPLGIVPGEIARLQPITARTQALRAAIADRRMLLVIDDVWDPEAGDTLRCGGPNCSHLLTTRDKNLAHAFSGAARTESLRELTDEEAYGLLHRLAPQACESDPDAARALVRAVGGLPQAVRLIGGYLSQPQSGLFGDVFGGLSAAAFQQMADPRARLALAGQRLGAGTGERTTLADTIRLSLHDLPDAARQAFACLGAFAPKPERFTPDAGVAVAHVDLGHFALLAARNLVEVDMSAQLLSVHPTVADVARIDMPAESAARHREHYLDVVRASAGDHQRVAAVYGQLRWAWQHAPDDESLFALLAAVEPYQEHRGLSLETTAWADRALAVAEARNVAPAAARMLEMRGDAERALGKYEHALSSYRKALAHVEAVEATFVPQVPDAESREKLVRAVRIRLIEIRRRIAQTLGKLGRLDEAMTEVEHTRKMAEAAGDGVREAEAFLVTALLLREAGSGVPDRFNRAIDAAGAALARMRALSDRAGEADCLTVLAWLHRDAGQPDKALEYSQATLALRTELGSMSGTAEAGLLHATIARELGDLEHALALAQEACAQAEESGSHDMLADGLGVAAGLLVRLGRVDEALTSYRRQLAMYDEVGNSAGRARTLKGIARAYAAQGRTDEELAAYEEAIRIQRQLGDPVELTDTLEAVHLTHVRRHEPDRALACLAEALGNWRALGNRDGQEWVLRHAAALHWMLEERAQALEAYQRADALYAETAQPVSVRMGSRAERLASRAGRFGPRIVDRRPPPRLVLALGTNLRQWVGGARVRPALLADLDSMRRLILDSMGMLPPRVIVADGRPDVDPDAYAIELDTIAVATGTLRADERLCDGTLEELSAAGVVGRSTVNPLNGMPAAWVPRADWPLVEAMGHTLFTGSQFIAQLHAQRVLRQHLHDLLDHQTTLDMVEQHELAALDWIRGDPAALGALVVLLRRLLDEACPILAFRAIVEAYAAGGANSRDGLDLLRMVRLLPGVRERLPGNAAGGTLAQLPAQMEEEIAAGVQWTDGVAFLALPPERTMTALATIRRHLGADSNTAAFVVEDGALRRFARKLVELEFPDMPVLSREELLPERHESVTPMRLT